MRSRYRVVEKGATQFITSTVVGWLPVFTTDARCKIGTDSLEYCRKHKGLKIHAWVILDNRFHAIVAAPALPRVMADFSGTRLGRSSANVELKNAIGCCHLLRQ